MVLIFVNGYKKVTIQRIAESTPPLLMERAGERRNKQAKSHFDSPHPTLSRWRGMFCYVLNSYIKSNYPSD
jgi:hypothetical protein